MISDIRIKELQVYSTPAVARTPLKFGAVVVEEVDFCRVKATVENRRGQVAEGWGGIFLMDFWGWPTFDLSHEAKASAMRELTDRYAALVALHTEPSHPIDLFFEAEEDLHRLSREVCQERGLTPEQPFLGALVCASPVDAALHDAFGNANGIDSYAGYGPDFMSDLSRYLGSEYSGKYVQDYLRPTYLPRVPIFHLVGGLDKLTRAELDDGDPQDGLPDCLADWIAHEGMYCLKVKLRGTDLDWDVERTLSVHRIGQTELAARGETRLHITADTNEQCESPEYIIEYLERIREQSQDCYDRILYIEQPTERDLTAHRHDMRRLSSMKPVIVDESLTDLDTMEMALELGWSGIALKTCKGHSADMIFQARARELGIPFSVQDLTNPGLSLLHSVGLGARTYTIMGVEANSRQFFPAATNDAEKKVHGGIFNLTNGEADTSSLRGTGLGYQMEKMVSDG
jgi:L-alanine-DL-glutamate epimerase-like enolase superfamily enzyme